MVPESRNKGAKTAADGAQRTTNLQGPRRRIWAIKEPECKWGLSWPGLWVMGFGGSDQKPNLKKNGDVHWILQWEGLWGPHLKPDQWSDRSRSVSGMEEDCGTLEVEKRQLPRNEFFRIRLSAWVHVFISWTQTGAVLKVCGIAGESSSKDQEIPGETIAQMQKEKG